MLNHSKSEYKARMHSLHVHVRSSASSKPEVTEPVGCETLGLSHVPDLIQEIDGAKGATSAPLWPCKHSDRTIRFFSLRCVCAKLHVPRAALLELLIFWGPQI